MPREKVVRRRLADGTVKEYRYQGRARTHTIGWLIEEYRRSPDYARKKPNTKAVYQRAMDHIGDHYHDVEIAAIRRRHVKGHRDGFADRPGLANQILSMWSILLQYAVEQEYVLANVASRVAALEGGEHRRWSQEIIDQALVTLPEHLRRAVVLALYTGQREGDCIAMRWSDYDGDGVQVTQEKTGAKLWIPCHPALKAELDGWKATTKALTILTRADGAPWARSRDFCQTFSVTKARKLPGLKGYAFHGLRKSAAAALAEAGCSTHEIAAITGHASLKEIERYTREAEQKHRAVAAMGKLVAFRRENAGK